MRFRVLLASIAIGIIGFFLGHALLSLIAGFFAGITLGYIFEE
ncbi:MAG: hypothetical protein ABIJ92_05195 [Candidatus Aenigmatarchaeota archaeon]